MERAEGCVADICRVMVKVCHLLELADLLFQLKLLFLVLGDTVIESPSSITHPMSRGQGKDTNSIR